MEGGASVKLQDFIDEHVLTDPEWREAYDEADATREAARVPRSIPSARSRRDWVCVR
jgi:hypothetical protein